MPLPNTRVVIVGAPRADKDFQVVEVSARAAQTVAKDLQRLAEQVARETARLKGKG
jgi:hypothetical protein